MHKSICYILGCTMSGIPPAGLEIFTCVQFFAFLLGGVQDHTAEADVLLQAHIFRLFLQAIIALDLIV